jgi:hypothetical protein
LNGSGKIFKGPIRDGVNVATSLQKETLGNLFALNAIFNTEVTSLIVVHRIEFTPAVGAGAKR